MDRNTIIGFLLIFVLLIAWQQFMAPSPEELQRQQQIQDSLRMEQVRQDSLARLAEARQLKDAQEAAAVTQDSASRANEMALLFGPFAPSAVGELKTFKLGNDVMEVTFTNKGGRIREVWLKDYYKVVLDSAFKEHKVPLRLLEDPKDKFEYLLPVPAAATGQVSTEDLYFDVQQSDNAITFRAYAGEGRWFEQRYELEPGSYNIKYTVDFVGLDQILDRSEENVVLNWVTWLDKLERNTRYERNYSTIYYKPTDDDPDYCSCTRDDEEDYTGQRLKWLAHSNQFFASILLPETAFNGAVMRTEVLDPEAEDLKKLSSAILVPHDGPFAMDMYVGPKDFETLYAYGVDLQEIIPFGRSIFGSINRWVIRPLFDFLAGLIGSKGLAILLLTFIVKMLLYPLTYRQIYSQQKMAALKPVLEKLRAKYKDDQQALQMEQMKIYREYGVNPLGGCLPVFLQMPIWFALYRFFPAAIEFRQESFLWATDLSSYDAIVYLPFTIPMYGNHISLFTILWAATTVWYTWYNSKQMDMSAMGGGANASMMKYMQYGMPLMFTVFFNSFASGLTCYLFFSNVLNVTQMVVTKNYVIDHEKIRQELEANKAKPKKKSGFQARLEQALKEQQRLQEQQQKKRKKK
ncbi:MAG: membrane protein insertase YidC [Bacteroidetes bacterium]|nr:MAG: membrane protein insertase YidC [Bacteroidota bacterium]